MPSDICNTQQSKYAKAGQIILVYISFKTNSTIQSKERIVLTGLPAGSYQEMKALATNVGFGVCVNNNNVTIEPDTVISADKWVRFMFAYIANR